ncbi:hypothetical protein F4604DRAFT_1924753 [Suillus subluteus]|nr:hypothetical protein F4604DRAFT_1924753 [Suillus subluteus]
MPRYPYNIKPRAPSSKPQKKVPVMSVPCPIKVETHAPTGASSTSLGPLDWAENPSEETAPVTTTHKCGPKVVDYSDKPGQFWPDGQEPPFKGQKHPKRNKWLEDDVQVMQSFHPRTSDVHLYPDYSDYDGSNEDNFFESIDDDYVPPHTAAAFIPLSTMILVPVAPSIPSTMIIQVLVGKWIDIEDNSLDPDDLDLLTKIMQIPLEVYYKLLPV